MLGITVWALLALGLYSGFKFFPVVLTKGRIERRVVSSVQNMGHDSTEEQMRLRVVTKGSSKSIQLLEEHVDVVRESEHGKRIFHIDVTHPSTVRYLGSDHTVTSRIQFTHVIVVDEVALARQKEYERVRREEYEVEQARARAFARQVDDARAECEEKWGVGNCSVTESYGGDSNHIIRMY